MKRGACDGQSAYVAHKIDGAVLATLKDYLAKIKSTPKDIALEKRYKSEISEYKRKQTKLEKEIDKKKLNKYVYMAGIQKDICGWLSTFDLFLFPSKFEGLSMAAMEAQANGVPMLASDSVIPKEVKINPSFIFWNLENSAESWAEEILNIKENINRVSQKEIVDNFTMRGYEIHTEAKKLEKILLNGVVNK